MSRPSFSISRPFRSSSRTPSSRAPSRDRSQPPRPPSTGPPARDDPIPDGSRRLSAQMRGMRRLEQRRTMEEQHYLNSKARAQNYNPPVDLRLLDYVSPFDDNLMCPICRCPFVEPVVLDACGHCFCRDCIRQCWHNNRDYNPLGPKGDCPTCRTPTRLAARDATSKILVNIVEDLMVKCPKSDEGCKAEIKRGEVGDHVAIYCGYALVECNAEDCDLPVRRRDASQGCLHYGVSCASCQAELQKWKLEAHWQNECPDREVECALCRSVIFYRELEEHSKRTCPAISIPCPGQALGCTIRSKRGQLDMHTKDCTLAKLAPVMEKQQQRLEEQEVAQKQMSRKLEVLENGFSALQGILYSSPRLDPDRLSADSISIPMLHSQRRPSNGTTATSESIVPEAFDLPVPPTSNPTPSLNNAPPPPSASTTEISHALPRNSTEAPSYHPTAAADFPPPSTTGGPYSSPLHHLLSLHESLREETSRVAAALAELDGRHSMQILNENLRTREEISYLGAQVAGLQRQVHWLTAAQLQRRAEGTEGAVGAVSTAATALRGAARVVGVGQNQGQGAAGAGAQAAPMRRRTSEEGRTKL